MEKPLVWMGQTYKELLAMPDNVQDDFGYALGVAQLGGVVSFAKPMQGNLRDVMEVVSNEEGDTYRRCTRRSSREGSTCLTSFKRKPSQAVQLRRLTWIGLS